MKRKNILMILIILFLTSYLYSYDLPTEGLYIVPFSTSAINLKSKHYPSRDTTNPDLNWNGNSLPSEETAVNAQNFYDRNIILLGGFAYDSSRGNTDESIRNALNGGKVVLSATTNHSALEFVSLSNSAYRRPFELYALVTSATAKTSNNTNIKRLSLVKIDSTNTKSSSGVISFTSTDYDSGSAVFFDLLLALPGTFAYSDSSTLNYNGNTYTLAENDDYSVMVTILMEFFDKDDNLIGSKTFSVPFSGYISSSTTTDSTLAAMSVTLNPIASVINLKQYAGQRFNIGWVDLIVNYGYTADSTYQNHISGTTDPKVVVFMSTSKNPYTSGEKFRFVRKNDKNSGRIIGDSNSLGFTLTLQDNTNIANSITFTGTESIVQSSGLMSNGSKDYVVTNVSDGIAIHATKTYHYHYLNGEIFMSLDSPPNGILQEGLYEETVYIHVISGITN